MPRGRPSIYTEILANQICDEIAAGSNLNKITSRAEMPNRHTIYLWFREYDDFFAKYTRAREDRADARADKIDDIVRKIENKELDPNAARVIIDALKWQAGKEKPKVYGDKLELSGALETSKLSDEQVDARIAALLGKARAADAAGGEGEAQAGT